VLEARSIDHDMQESGGGTWVLVVDPALVYRAYEEMNRYRRSAARRAASRPRKNPSAAPCSGPWSICRSYCSLRTAPASACSAPIGCRSALSTRARGASGGGTDCIDPALDQEHLLGIYCSECCRDRRRPPIGAGGAWASILGAGAIANYMEILISPPAHRAVGASTAVFAALGLLAGLAWRQRLTLRERRWYRWAPIISGVCLLTLLGAGSGHVDVLGHALGFLCGSPWAGSTRIREYLAAAATACRSSPALAPRC